MKAELIEKKKSSVLILSYDLRDSADDDCQRMLNAIEPGTFIPPHRHTNMSEDVVVLRGIAEEIFFSDDG